MARCTVLLRMRCTKTKMAMTKHTEMRTPELLGGGQPVREDGGGASMEWRTTRSAELTTRERRQRSVRVFCTRSFSRSSGSSRRRARFGGYDGCQTCTPGDLDLSVLRLRRRTPGAPGCVTDAVQGVKRQGSNSVTPPTHTHTSNAHFVAFYYIDSPSFLLTPSHQLRCKS